MLLKVTLGVVFMTIGIMTTYLAMTMAMNGLSEKGIRCMTGIAVFIPLSFVVNIVGIPLVLLFYKSNTKNISG